MSISSSASSATYRSAAATATTGSPSYRAMPCAIPWKTVGAEPGNGRRTAIGSVRVTTSSPRSTASTPRCPRARRASMRQMRACGYGQRPMARCRASASSTSSTKRLEPRRRRSSSLRFTLAPSQGSLSIAPSRGPAQVARDGFDDVLVARAPAEVAGQLLAQRRALEDDAAIGQRDGAEQEARGAVPALERVRVAERLLHRVQLPPPGQAFHRRDGAAVRLGGEHEARLHRLAVEEHRARAADALLAADVGAVEIELVAQEVDE